MAKISVIVPVYNVERYLNRCVESILKQTFSDFELILVDDGSPDNCPKMCEDFALKDKRVKVIHIPNGGVSMARNVGIEYALTSDSEWIIFADSDDYVDENYLQLLYNACVDTGTNISVCAYTSKTENINLSEIKITKEDVEDFWSSVDSGRFSIHGPWAKLFKKELLKDVRFPVGKRNEDRFFMHKVWFLVKEIAKVDAPLYFYYLREDSFTHQDWSSTIFENIEACEEEIAHFTKDNKQGCLKRSLTDYLVLLAEVVKNTKGKVQFADIYNEYSAKLKKELKENAKKCAIKGYKKEIVYSCAYKRWAFLYGVKNFFVNCYRFVRRCIIKIIKVPLRIFKRK